MSQGAQSQSQSVRVFCDESGFSGNNLLDRDQPYFSYAAVIADPEPTAEFITKLIDDFDIQGGELKGSRLLKYNKGRQAISEVLKRYHGNFRIAVHEKRFALASQFFEYVFEPALASQNSIFYKAHFHRFIAGIVYTHWIGRDQPAEQLISSFSQMMRSLDGKKLQAVEETDLIHVDDRRILDHIAVFALLNKQSIDDELNVIYGDGTTPNWVLDLSTTSLFQILSDFGTRYAALEVFCDVSKPLLANRDIFDRMVNRTDMPTRLSVWGDQPFGFNLGSEPKFVDSVSTPGIQIADVLAAASSFIFQNRSDPQAKIWLPHIEDVLVNCILPDLDYANPHTEDGFVGAMILRELVDRSLKKENFFDGMPEFIAAAREMFPEWLARGVNRD
jgi:hypothetical protein